MFKRQKQSGTIIINNNHTGWFLGGDTSQGDLFTADQTLTPDQIASSAYVQVEEPMNALGLLFKV